MVVCSMSVRGYYTICFTGACVIWSAEISVKLGPYVKCVVQNDSKFITSVWLLFLYEGPRLIR